MATIRTAIELQDSFSGILYHVIDSVNLACSAMEDMSQSMNTSVDTTSLEAARRSIDQATIAVQEMNAAMQNTGAAIDENTRRQGLFNREIQEGADSTGNLMGKIKGAVAAYATIQTVTAALDLSDQMTATTARLNLMNDGLQTTQELQNMIYLSAERSRGSYQATADAVSKLGMMAGDAFGSSEEVIAFMEQVNKQFTIAGTETAGIDAAMLQLTQAMGSGILRGEEFNSIMEQAPNIIQAIADYMGVPKGQLKDIAAEGQITAEIVKASMFAAAEETNAKFEQMPKTFSQIWTSFQNQALMAFQPVLQRLNGFANSAAFQRFVSVAIAAVVRFAGIVMDIFDLIAAVGGFVADNWSIIEPIVWGIVWAFAAYHVSLVIAKVKTAALTIATFAQMAAQEGLNAAIKACPVTWIIIGIIAIIAVFYAAIAAINKLTGSTYSAAGIICGILSVACAFITNLFITFWNISAEVFAGIWNAVAALANFFGNVFNDPVAAVVKLFVDVGNVILGIVEGILEALSWITFGSLDLTDGVAELRDYINGCYEEEFGDRYTEYVQTVNPEFLKMETVDYGDAWDAGYSLGEDIENAIANMNLFGTDGSNIPDAADYADLSSYGAGLTGGVEELVENTGAIRDAVDITEEDLKYLRDIAEQEAVNRFTTAEIVIEQTNHNNISGKMDLDGVVTGLTDAVNEAVDMIAEGVHD